MSKKRATLEMVFEYDEAKFENLTDERVKDMAQDTALAHPGMVWDSITVEDIDSES
jgi:hypothetical protein